MAVLTLPRRDPTPGIHAQQRFSFGESRQQVAGSRRYRAAWHYLTGDATPQMVPVLEIKVSPANFKILIAT
jgi:hypothetical protein